MKNILRNTCLGAMALVTFGFSGCSKDDPASTVETPKIVISNVVATSSNVSFTLTPKDCSKYTYAVALKGQTGTETTVEGNQPATKTVDGLEADKTYTITAIPYATDGVKGTSVTHDFVTNPKATVVIGTEIEVTFNSASVTLTPTNATKYAYAYYPSATKPAELQWIEIVGNDPQTVELADLTPDTEYLLEAFATNVEGDGEVVISDPFRTQAMPQVTIGAVTATAKTATFTLTPTAATGFAYICYVSGHRPTDPTWVKVTSAEAKEVIVENLTPKTDYVIEAYGFNANGDGAIVTSPVFRTTEAAPLTVNAVATAKSVLIHFELNKDKAAGYKYSTLIDPNDEYTVIHNIEEFLADVAAYEWSYPLQEADQYNVLTCESNKTYKLYAVCCDEKGVAIPTMAQEITITTLASDRTGTGQATVTIGNVTPGSITLSADLSFSDNSAMYLVNAVPKSKVDQMGGNIKMFVNGNLDTFQLNAVGSMENPAVVRNLAPDTEYYIFAIAIDRNGKFGEIISKLAHTAVIEYDPNVTITLTPNQVGFTNVVFDVALKGAPTQIRIKNLTKFAFIEQYESDKSLIYKDLYGELADQMYIDETNHYKADWLEYHTEYLLIALPVKEDGSFGTPFEIEYSTAKFEATGTSIVTVTQTDAATNLYTFTATPGSGCAKFIWKDVVEETYNINKKNIGDYVARNFPNEVSPATETPIEVALWGESAYLVVISCDENGKWSEPLVSEKLAYTASSFLLKR